MRWIVIPGILLYCLLPTWLGAQGSPAPKREFRAAWITTLANMEWPSKSTLHPSLQKLEFTSMLDRLQAAGMNAVVVQIRAAGDAFYPSKLVPWSAYLTGKQGRAPEPWYDPLAFMIAETHKRNMEFHAWFNPLRAQSHVKLTTLCADNVALRQPTWTYVYGEGRYFNPGVPEVRDYLVQVVMEVVRGYDIDGVHFDDYFYPYPIEGKPIPDMNTYLAQGGSRVGTMDDWRRDNIDRFVQACADSIRAAKPWVKFGISPFGIWRGRDRDAEGSETYGTATSYDNLYADVRKWIRAGWLDYVAPQLYWSIRSKRIPFNTIMNWWVQETRQRHVYVGHAAYRIAQTGTNAMPAGEILDQVQSCRSGGVCGNIYFRSEMLLDDVGGLSTGLRAGPYRYPAFIPPMPWKDSIPPGPPQNTIYVYTGDGLYLDWDAPAPAPDGDSAAYYAVYRFPDNGSFDLDQAQYITYSGKETHFIDFGFRMDTPWVYVITTFDRMHNESTRFEMLRIQLRQTDHLPGGSVH